MSALHTINGVPALVSDGPPLIDEERAGTKSGWSHDDRVKLERLRALAKP